MKTFQNPIYEGAPDPWITKRNGKYYFLYSKGQYGKGKKISEFPECGLYLFSGDNLSDVAKGTPKCVLPSRPNCSYAGTMWAPELHYLQGCWYIYFSGDDGQGSITRKVHVLRNQNEDPMEGEWENLGPIGSNPVGIDGTVIENKGELYFVYAAYLVFPICCRTDLYIYHMSNPYTLDGEPVNICQAEYEWEINKYRPEWKITEGPVGLYRNGKTFLVYSANTVSFDYALGMLTIDDDADFMDPNNWKKSEVPVFETSAEDHVYGPGHNSFTTSPDGTEDWIVYHAMYEPAPKEGQNRVPRRDTCIKKFTWNEDGTPNFGKPAPMYTDIPAPSGE